MKTLFDKQKPATRALLSCGLRTQNTTGNLMIHRTLLKSKLLMRYDP
jgi:hypothetical protein